MRYVRISTRATVFARELRENRGIRAVGSFVLNLARLAWQDLYTLILPLLYRRGYVNK